VWSGTCTVGAYCAVFPHFVQAEINTWVVLSVALPGMTSDPNVMLPAASVGMLLAIGTAGLTVSLYSASCLP